VAVVDAAKRLLGLSETKFVELPPGVKQKLERGRERMRQGAARRRLYLRFWRGEQYWYVNEKGSLAEQATVTHLNGGGKPPHRVREPHNLIRPLVEGKVSAATQRTPSYQVNPSSSIDPNRVNAAALGQKIALYGYDKWRLLRVRKKVVTFALVAEEGFAWPIWDRDVGPYALDEATGRMKGRGEVRIRTFSRNQVIWEPGLEFDESPWHGVQQGMTVDAVKGLDGYLGGELTEDAGAGAGADTAGKKDEKARKLVMVTDFLERPCQRYPTGRWLTIANNRVVAGVQLDEEGKPLTDEQGKPVYRPYPLTDHDDKPVDEPVLHRLSYTVDPDSDEDTGMVRDLVGPQRTYTDCWNKISETKNRRLNNQMIAPVGSQIQRRDDTPGAIIYYRPVGGQPPPSWEPTGDAGALLNALFEVLNQAKAEMQYIAGSDDLPPALASGPSIQAFIEQQQQRWATFIADLSEFDSRLMRHCLWLVQKYYDEPRTMSIRGEFGAEPIKDFVGVNLLGEQDVRVLPDSLSVLTRQAVQQQVEFLAQNFPQQMSMEQALSAIQNGGVDNLLQAYRYDMEEAYRMIQLFKAGPDVVFSLPKRPIPGTVQTDPTTGQPILDETGQPLPQEEPGWLPRKCDNVRIFQTVIGNYMKTPDYHSQPQTIQEAISIYYDALLQLEQKAQADMVAAQQQAAQGLGSANAGRPQGQIPFPSMPASGNGGAPQPAATT
jgi:hypothetical protein